MSEHALLLYAFSRRRVDRTFASDQLAFLLHYAGGILRPDECGAYDPFERFSEAGLKAYLSWLVAPGGQFGFRRCPPPLAVTGQITNLLVPDVFVMEEGSSKPQLLPNVRPRVFALRWSMRIGPDGVATSGEQAIRNLLFDVCRVAEADYGFLATDEDYRSKHLISLRRNESETQEYVGDDPEQGIPGLYAMNFFGPMYVDWFGAEKIAGLTSHFNSALLPDGSLYLQLGDGFERRENVRVAQQQRAALRILGEAAFFDIHEPGRLLDVPPALSRKL